MKLADMADDVRMAHRQTIELAGGQVETYDGEWFLVAIPCPSRPFYDAMNDAGWECCDGSLHFFPLGSDVNYAPDYLRHDGSYKGSKGFWLYGRFKPPVEHTCAGMHDTSCDACHADGKFGGA